MIVLRELAPAKVNLYLHVTGRRVDGYHLLDSLVAFADVVDVLEVVPAEQLSLTLRGPYANEVPAESNSVLQAAEMLRRHAGREAGASLTLYKNLPVAAGLGGGSADAAATLRLLMRLWDLKPPRDELKAIALALGADVPACLRCSSLYMQGIGETIESGPELTGMPLVLANPGKSLSTPDVFAGFKPPFSSPARHPGAFASRGACAGFLQKCRNDLEEPAISLVPEIRQVLEALGRRNKCLLARMSGSGATCFGLFADEDAAQAAAFALAKDAPGWWVREAALL